MPLLHASEIPMPFLEGWLIPTAIALLGVLIIVWRARRACEIENAGVVNVGDTV